MASGNTGAFLCIVNHHSEFPTFTTLDENTQDNDMVVGNGLLAKAFNKYKEDLEIIIFASGVSYSKELNTQAFDREISLLKWNIENAENSRLIYFSTCSIYDTELANSPYVLHKISQEKLIQDSGIDYHIFRLSNPIGFTENKNTIINYLFDKIKQGDSFDLWVSAHRNILDIDDVKKVVEYVIDSNIMVNETINIANKSNYSLLLIVNTIEKIVGKIAKSTLLQKGGNPIIDTTITAPIFKKLGIFTGSDYLENVLKKYHGIK